MVWFFIIVIFVLAVVFTWTNGFHHSSAVAAGAFGSHSLSRSQVVVLIFIFEFFGTMLGGSAVAGLIRSLSSWVLAPSLLPLLASALLSAILWNVISQRAKVPASSTHSLIGGMIGALYAGDLSFEHVRLGEFNLLHPGGVIGACLSLVLSPMLGFILAYILYCMLLIVCMNAPRKIEKTFQHLQWLTTAGLAFGDGQNDTQKTMGLLVLALNAAGFLEQHEIPIWVRVMIGLAMAGGALFISKGIVKELAYRVYELRPLHACVAEFSAATILVSNSVIGGPVSASQVIATSIMGTGSAEHCKAIHWLAVKNILLSWLITIPASALLAVVIHATVFRWLGAGL